MSSDECQVCEAPIGAEDDGACADCCAKLLLGIEDVMAGRLHVFADISAELDAEFADEKGDAPTGTIP